MWTIFSLERLLWGLVRPRSLNHHLPGNDGDFSEMGSGPKALSLPLSLSCPGALGWAVVKDLHAFLHFLSFVPTKCHPQGTLSLSSQTPHPRSRAPHCCRSSSPVGAEDCLLVLPSEQTAPHRGTWASGS